MAKPVVAINTPNQVKYFYPADDNWEHKLLPFKASVEIAEGAALGIEISSNVTTGYITLMDTVQAHGHDFVGIMSEPIVSTDADYATAGKLKGVRVPKNPNAKAYFAVAAGTLATADRFSTVAFHSDSLGLACDTLGLGARIQEILVAGTAGTGKGICTFNCPNTQTA